MGTRGLIGFHFNQQDFLAYNHFDSYPESLGEDAVALAATISANVDEYLDKLAALRIIDEQADKPTEKDKQRCKELGLVDLGVSNQSEDDWYCLLRNAQGKPLSYLDAGVFPASNDFALDSLFCEYAYIFNLDTKEIEFYKGFNKDPEADGRYASKHRERDGEYYGIALKGTAPLDNIPEDWQTQFYPDEEE